MESSHIPSNRYRCRTHPPSRRSTFRSAKTRFLADSGIARSRDPSHRASFLRQQARKVTWTTEVRRWRVVPHHRQRIQSASNDACRLTAYCDIRGAVGRAVGPAPVPALVPVFPIHRWMSQQRLQSRPSQIPLMSIPVANTLVGLGEVAVTNQCSQNRTRPVLVTFRWKKRVTLQLRCDISASRTARHPVALTPLSRLHIICLLPILLPLIHD